MTDHLVDHAVSPVELLTLAQRRAARGLTAALAEDGFAVAAVDLSAEACADVVGQIVEGLPGAQRLRRRGEEREQDAADEQQPV